MPCLVFVYLRLYYRRYVLDEPVFAALILHLLCCSLFCKSKLSAASIFTALFCLLLVPDAYCNVTLTAHAGTHDVPVVALSMSAAPIANIISPRIIFTPVLMFPLLIFYLQRLTCQAFS